MHVLNYLLGHNVSCKLSSYQELKAFHLFLILAFNIIPSYFSFFLLWLRSFFPAEVTVLQ